MSVENTQRTMEAYLEDLVGGGPYKRHFADDVVVALAGSDQGAEGPDDAEAWIDYLHREAFEAHPELKSRPFEPHPLFAGFIEAALKQSRLV